MAAPDPRLPEPAIDAPDDAPVAPQGHPLLSVLYLDNHLLVVDKPAGVLVQEDRTGDLDLLTAGKAYLKDRYDKPGNVYLGLVHRLDRPVSGVMVFARTSKAAARLSEQFRRRTPTKGYLALVEGRLERGGRWEDHLAKRDRHVHVVPPSAPDARRAVLSCNPVARLGSRTLVAIALETGRPHQIRVQLAHHGHPIVGDLRYGARHELDGRNLALHAYALTIEHPTRRVAMTWRSAPPPTWGDAQDAAAAWIAGSAA